MPGPVINKPTSLFPDWVKPENASVFDPGWRGPLRTLIGLLGLDDPQQVMGVGAAMEAGSEGGGMLEKLAEKFPRVAKAIRAYHGSPHDFEQFSTSQIGTGEGGQAFGHGIYFAETPAVAESYKKAGGKMYEVAIHHDPAHFLDWNRPFTEQSEFVQQALQPTMEYLKSRPLNAQAQSKLASGAATGKDIYLWLSGEKTFDRAMTTWPAVGTHPNVLGTQALQEAGIPGIKYWDQFSRAAEEGTRNFVVFDDRTIEILKKYGLLLPAAGLGAAQATTPQPQRQ